MCRKPDRIPTPWIIERRRIALLGGRRKRLERSLVCAATKSILGGFLTGSQHKQDAHARDQSGTTRQEGKFVVGVDGFEPPTARPPAECSTRLSYTP